MTDRTSTYLGVLRVSRNLLVFTVSPQALNSLSEWLAPLKPRGGAWREMGVSPDRGRPSLRTEMVSVGPVGESPIMTDRGTKIAEWGHIVVIRPVPPRESSWLLHLWD